MPQGHNDTLPTILLAALLYLALPMLTRLASLIDSTQEHNDTLLTILLGALLYLALPMLTRLALVDS